MNKLFTKIGVAMVGFAMAVGVGVAVGSKPSVEKAKATATVGTYNKVTGDTLEVGADYLLSYGTRLMGNTVSSNRITNSSTTITSGANSVSNPDDSAVWTLGNRVVGQVTYWTFYNAAAKKYLLGNTSDSRASLNASANDTTACWSVTASDNTFDFTLKGSTRRLRNNATYGWASYTTTTGGALTLYKKVTYTVSFNAGTGGSGTMASTKAYGSYTLPTSTFTAPSGSAFVGWKANNSGDILAVGSSYNVSADVTFYAQWASQRTLAYNSNGGSGTMTDSNSPYGDGATVTVKACTFTAPSGKGFDHWDTKADDSGIDYAPGDTFSISENTTLYAQWVALPTYNQVSSNNDLEIGATYFLGGTTDTDNPAKSYIALGTTDSTSSAIWLEPSSVLASTLGSSYNNSLPTGVFKFTLLDAGKDGEENQLYYLTKLTAESGLYHSLTRSAVKKVGFNTNDNNTTNAFASTDTIKWLISVDSEKHTATIKPSGASERIICNYNGGSVRFTTYADTTATSGTMCLPFLYKLSGSSFETSALDFANTSLKMNDSKYSGEVNTEDDPPAACTSNYAAMKTAYDNLNAFVKNVFLSSSNTTLDNARARAAAWAVANGETFSGGIFSSAKNPGFFALNSNENSATTTIIVISSAIALVSIVGYFVIRRKKEN